MAKRKHNKRVVPIVIEDSNQYLLGGMLGGLSSMASNAVSGGKSTGVGGAMQAVGSLASNIPGIGGVIGAGVNVLGGVVNNLFGSKLNDEFIQETEAGAADLRDTKIDDSTVQSVLQQQGDIRGMGTVSKDQVGSDGVFSNKAAKKTRELNKKIADANTVLNLNMSQAFDNANELEDLKTMGTYSAYGGPLFDEGGGIHIKKKNRGKFTAYCGGTVTDACISRGLNSDNPTTRKRANFARNARKWNHAEGGYLYEDGGGIHIKKANRGKFTEYCGGKVTSECIARGKNSSSPAVRKRATFAANARKWSKAEGGFLDDYSKPIPGVIYNGAYDSISEYPDMFTHGGVFSDGVVKVGEGDSHENNPRGGVPMGVAPDGQPNLVEEGEVVFNDYVFSNRLKADDNLLEAFNLAPKYKGKTFAQIADSINKEPSEKPNDPISKRGLTATMSKLMQAQESLKESKNRRTNGRQFADGGPYKTYKNFTNIGDDWYTDDYMGFVDSLQEGNPDSMNWLNRINSGEFGDIGGNTFTDISDIKRLATDRKKGPVHNAMTAASRVYNDSRRNPGPIIDNPINPFTSQSSGVPTSLPMEGSAGPMNDGDDEEKKGIGLEALRYAPAVGAGVSLFSDMMGLTNKPDYSGADSLEGAIRSVKPVAGRTIGNYLRYTPFDTNYAIGKLDANSGATRRALRDNAGGNRATAAANLIAADYNYGTQMGDLFRQAQEYNQAQRERVEGFNRGTNQFNAESLNRADVTNMQAAQQANELRLRQKMTQANMRDQADMRSSTARSANLSNFYESLGNIGREEFSRNIIESNPALGYSIGRDGRVTYKNNKKKKQ
jgi:hypothetical protein